MEYENIDSLVTSLDSTQSRAAINYNFIILNGGQKIRTTSWYNSVQYELSIINT